MHHDRTRQNVKPLREISTVTGSRGLREILQLTGDQRA